MKKDALQKDTRTKSIFFSSFVHRLILISSIVVLLFVILFFIPQKDKTSYLKILPKNGSLLFQININRYDQEKYLSFVRQLNIDPQSLLDLEIDVSPKIRNFVKREKYITLEFNPNQIKWQMFKEAPDSKDTKLWQYLDQLPANTFFYHHTSNIANLMSLLINWPAEFNSWFSNSFSQTDSALAIFPVGSRLEFVVISRVDDLDQTQKNLEQIFEVIENIKIDKDIGKQALTSVKISKDNENTIYHINLPTETSDQKNQNLNFVTTIYNNLILLGSSKEAIVKITTPTDQTLATTISTSQLPKIGKSASYVKSPKTLVSQTLPFYKIHFGQDVANWQNQLEVIDSLYFIETGSTFEGMILTKQ